MKIAFLTPSTGLGGAEWSLLDLLSSLRTHDPALGLWLMTSGASPLAARAREMGVQLRVVPMPARLAGAGDSAMRFGGAATLASTVARAAAAGPAAWRWSRALGQALSEIRPDVVHTNDNKSHLVSAWMPRGGAPVVWHVRDFIGRRRLLRLALAVSSPRPAGVIAISESVARDVRQVLPGAPVVTIHNAIDLERFSPDGARADLDALAGVARAEPGAARIGLVATYARWKGHDLFLEAVARYTGLPSAAPARFYIIGGPIYRTAGSQWTEAELRAEARRRGVADHVAFVGFQEETPAIYRALDIVVHASTEPEPFGRTIVEAMGCRRAVVVSRAGGAAELVTPGHDAMAFEPGDASDLAGSLLSLAGDAGRRLEIAARARATAERRFSRSRLGPEVLSAYRRFLAKRNGAGPSTR